MKIRLAEPCGFCAGVRRAVTIVDEAQKKYGTIYLIHELVHNEQVTAELAARGVRSVSSLDDVPVGAVLVVSAHGAVPQVFESAEKKGLTVIDATCPLVRQVQLRAAELTAAGYHLLLFGKSSHREVEGIIGHAEAGMCTVLENRDAVFAFQPRNDRKYATLSQTTLNEQEIAVFNDELKRKIPGLLVSGNVCQATSARQQAVRDLAGACDAMLIIGSNNSSNTVRLYEVASEICSRVYLVSNTDDLPDLDGVDMLGISAGASAPESLILTIVNQASRVSG